MKQVLQAANGAAVVRDVPPPACPPGGVLVQNAYSAISSGTERARVALAEKSLLAKARERPDLVRQVVERARVDGVLTTYQTVAQRLEAETAVGYSSAGTVIEVGSHVRDLRPDDRVACAGAGHANHAEIVAVPRNLVARIPEGVSLDVAALTTIAAISLNGVRLAEVSLGSRVGVIGCGLVGQIACRLLSAAGAEVFAFDINDARVDQACRGGADHGLPSEPSVEAHVLKRTAGAGLDAVLVTAAASDNSPLDLGARLARDRGVLILVGAVPIELPREPLYDKELVFRVSRSYGPGRYDIDYEERGLDYPIGYVRWTEQRNMEAILHLQARDRLTLADLIDDIVPVAAAADAYARLTGPSEQQPQGAIVLSYPDASAPADAEPPDVAPTALSSRLSVGLIGPGSFAGKVLVPALTTGGAQLELVGGGSGPSAELAARRLGFRRVAATAEAVTNDPGVNVVVIATRHATHAELAERALRSGKHVFCEKPLALDRDELARVLTAAHESSGILLVGFNRRFSPLLQRAKEFFTESAGLMTVIYRVNPGHLPLDHWTHDLEQGGGRVIGEVCHFVDSLAFLVGAPIVRVDAIAHGDADLPTQALDNVVATLRFADGSVGAIVYAAEGSPRVSKERIEASRTGRTAILDDYRSLELFDKDRSRERLRVQDKGHRAEVKAFLDGVRDGIQPVTLAEIENVMLATFAIVDSIRTGKPVHV